MNGLRCSSKRSLRGALAALALIFIALARPTAALAAPTNPALDEVVLRDGSKMQGRVSKDAPSGFVVIVTTDGRRHTLTWEVVREVNLAPPAPLPQVPRSPTARGPFARALRVASYEVRGEATEIVLPTQKYDVTGSCATGTGLAPVSIYGHQASARGIGVGGGVGGRAAVMMMWPPISENRSSWWALRAASGLDLNVLYGRVPTGVSPASGVLCLDFEKQTQSADSRATAIWLAQVPFTFGAQIGLGGFRGAAIWRGFVLGFGWSPTVSYVKAGSDGGSLSFNPLGTEVTFDITTLDLVKTVAPRPLGTPGREAHVRIAAALLPPFGDSHPLVMTLSVGAVWY